MIAAGESPGSRRAAEIIRDAIRKIPGQESWNNVQSAAAFDAKPFDETGQVHIIAVGTLADNVVLQGRNWLPTWWLDRDWYYAKYPWKLTPDQTGLAYQPTSGFVVGGYGEWPSGTKGVGLMEVDRSNYFMEWLVRSRYDKVSGGRLPESGKDDGWRDINNAKQATYPRDFPLRLIVRISGSGDAGIVAAAEAFAQAQMLGGVVLADGAKADETSPMFALPARCYARKLPFEPPAVAGGYTYHGWLLPDAFLYDGLVSEARVWPAIMFRVKYRPPFGITNFWSTPHRRAGQFELLAAKFASPDECAKAKRNLETALAGKPPAKRGFFQGFNMLAVGNVLYMESLPEPAGAELLGACARIGAW